MAGFDCVIALIMSVPILLLIVNLCGAWLSVPMLILIVLFRLSVPVLVLIVNFMWSTAVSANAGFNCVFALRITE
jgi:hypothetical protein